MDSRNHSPTIGDVSLRGHCSSAACQYCLSTATRNVFGGRSRSQKISPRQLAKSLCRGTISSRMRVPERRYSPTHPPAHVSGTGDHGRRERAKSTHAAGGPMSWYPHPLSLRLTPDGGLVGRSPARSVGRSVDHAARAGCGEPTLRAPQLVGRRRARWPACCLSARQTV